MAISKRTFRDRFGRMMNAMRLITATNDGAANGSTILSTQFNGYSTDFFRSNWVVGRTGGNLGKYAIISASSGSPYALTIQPNTGTQFLTNAVVEVHQWDPTIYTEVANEAIRLSYPDLFLAVQDSSIVYVANDYNYTLPAGTIPKMIKKVMVEGTGNYDELPYLDITEYVNYNPVGTQLWLNQSKLPIIDVGRKIYLFTEKPLTALATDTDYGTLVTDTTDLIELTENTDHWQLFLMYAKAALFSTLASLATQSKRNEFADNYGKFLDAARVSAPRFRMPRLDQQW